MRFLRELYYLRFYALPNTGVRNRGVLWDEHLTWRPSPTKYGISTFGMMGNTGEEG